MAFVHGKTAVFKIDNSGGSLQDISAYCDNVDFPLTSDTAEVTTFWRRKQGIHRGPQGRHGVYFGLLGRDC
jgi:hypothetical protein